MKPRGLSCGLPLRALTPQVVIQGCICRFGQIGDWNGVDGIEVLRLADDPHVGPGRIHDR